MERKNGGAKNNNDSIYEKDIQRGISKGIISVAEDKSKIIYNAAQEHKENLKDPEEKVRAAFFGELVLDYGYNPNRIRLEVPVPRRTPEDRADIVVYEDDELKKPYLVVECKKDGITDAEFKQAIEQVFGNANSMRAQFAAVIAGTTRTAFNVAEFKPNEREKNVIADIPKKYGKAPKYKFIKGEPQDELKIISKEELIQTLKKSHDTVWQGGRLAPTTAFDEVSKLLFCKLKDEKDTTKGSPYKFQIGTHETADEVFNRINGIYQKAKEQDAEVFKEDIRLDPKIFYSVVEHLQGIALTKTDLDTKGVAFETFMTDFFKGKMGQFFTPREIIRFAVRILNPTKDDLVLDPAAGSGGFLLNSMDNVRESAEKDYEENEAWEHWHSFARQNLYGIEINDQIARVCKMNMIIHDDGHTNVISTDSLRDFEEIQAIHKGFGKDHFDIVLTNPPFGATIKRTEKDYLDKYELGKGKDAQKSEILFIERVINFVKPGNGRIGIVLPDGILTNSSLQYVRDFIMERCQILAVVSLPQFAFSHYGAGVKASLVFLRRKGNDEVIGNYPIFMAIAEHIGYDATGRKDPQNDLDKIIEEYYKFLENSANYQGG
ncbi:MAG: restriction endonuclease subunit M [Caldisericum sp.]|uniref:restriction endonuclease subunit M n=1 Tax=Caldisericum sp. TaxID=2499687 RepID=UPI003D0D06E5